MNGGAPATLAVPLAFLGTGRWTLREFADAPDSAERAERVVEATRPVAAGETLELKLTPAGGYAGVLVPGP